MKGNLETTKHMKNYKFQKTPQDLQRLGRF